MNPFTIGIAQGIDFCNREEEKASLTNYARNANNVVLFSPRRYGKSSLVTRVLNDLKKEKYITIYVDLFAVSSEQEFVSKFSTAIIKSLGNRISSKSLLDKAKSFFSRITPVIEIKQDKVAISTKFDYGQKVELLLDDVMESLHKYVKDNKVKACIVFDEFQEITELKEAKKIEGILRSHIQFHKEIAYFYVGSRRRILMDMFTNSRRPFYKSAFLFEISEISREHFVPYIISKFRNSNKKCSQESADLIYDLVRGYPYYVQKLASIAWDMTDSACDAQAVDGAYKLLLDMEAQDFEGIWGGLTLSQKEVLKAIAKEPTSSPYSQRYLESYHLTVGGVQKAIKLLMARDLIEKDKDTKLRLTDPVMANWLN